MRGWQGKNKKGGKIKEEGIRGRETVVLFSLVWHYLSLLINPLRPSAWRSEGNRGEGGGGCTREDMSALRAGCLWVKVSRWCHNQAHVLPPHVDFSESYRKYCCNLKSASTVQPPSSDLLSSLFYALFMCKVVTEK